jgi:hypothetical protein
MFEFDVEHNHVENVPSFLTCAHYLVLWAARTLFIDA